VPDSSQIKKAPGIAGGFFMMPIERTHRKARSGAESANGSLPLTSTLSGPSVPLTGTTDQTQRFTMTGFQITRERGFIQSDISQHMP